MANSCIEGGSKLREAEGEGQPPIGTLTQAHGEKVASEAVGAHSEEDAKPPKIEVIHIKANGLQR